MADPIIRVKRSSVPGKIPNETQVPLGEIALNTYDGKVFASKNVGIGTTVFVVNPWTVGAGTDAYNAYFTNGNVGIGTTLPTSKLHVDGDANFTGVVTASNSAVIKSGTATTALLVEGHTRIVGILTIGTSSITLDGDINQVNVGAGVTLHHINGVQVGENTLHTSGLTLNHVNLSGITTLGTVKVSSGIITAVSGIVTYYGDGQYLQNILSGVGVATAGGLVGTGATILDFRGAGISTVTVSAGIATINIVGGGSGGGGSVSIGTEAPSSPSAGSLWYNSDLGRTFIYYNDTTSSQWVDAAPFNIPSTPTAAKSTTALTASEGQTTFGVIYTVGYIDVYLNGIRLSDSEFSATSGTAIILNQAASNGDILDVVEYTMGKGLEGQKGDSGPLSPVVSISSNTTYYPLFVSGIGTVDPYITTTSNYFDFNPSSGTLDVNKLVVAGTSGTSLLVQGDTRIVGVLTVGSSSITINGTTNTINSENINSSGIITAATFSGSGASLTTLNASNISSGTLGNARLPQDINVSGIVTASTFSGSGASLTTLNASNISSGTVPTARLATGTADSTTYLRGDQTWATVTSGITITNDTSTNATRYLTFTSATSGSISAQNVSSTKLTFNPSTGALSATDFNSTSDVNLKENISTIENSISKINSLRGVSFSWKETNKKSYGVIAQELEEVLPELVNTADFKSVNYNGLIGVLIEAVKEQQEQINTLKREIEDLRNER